MKATVGLSSLLAFGLMAGAAQAASLDMVTGNDYQPFSDSGLPEGGLAVEVVKKALATQDVDVNVDFLPWARGYKQTARGDVDATFPYIRTDDRKKEVLFSEPFFEIKPQVISAADNPVRFDGEKASLDGLTVCRPVGYAMEPMIDAMIQNGRLDTQDPDGIGQCPPLVKAGRIDFFVENNFVWPGLAKSEGLDRSNYHVAETPIRTNNLYVIVGKAHPRAGEIITTINNGLSQLHETGQFDQIVTKHIGDSM